MDNNLIDKVKNNIKAKIIEKGYTLKALAPLLAEKYNNPHLTVANLSYKLNKGTLKYIEALQIADFLNFDIDWNERKNK